MWTATVLLALLLLQQSQLSMGQSLEGKKLNIVTVTSEPFVIPDAAASSGFKGFYIDALELLKRELKFNYDIYQVADGQYGRFSEGKWSGLIGDIVSMKANATLAPLRITGNRIESVDFTVPISTSGMSILYKSSSRQRSSLSPAILVKPFAATTWFLLILVYIIYTVVAFAIWLVSPYELNSRSVAEATAIGRARKAGCGAWLFVTGGLFLQGFARAPKAPSARVLGFAWWLFVLASVSCYIANLVPLMTTKRATDTKLLKFKGLKDLVKQTKVAYGAFRNGATQKMLEDSNLPLLQRAFNYLEANPSSYVNTTAEAIERVKRGNYAWIAEGVTADYHAASSCELESVPAGLSELYFGMAVAKGSSLKTLLDKAILKVTANGELQALKQRWWAGSCGTDGEGNDGAADGPLFPGDLAGLYVLLLLGAIAALAVLPVERWLKGAGVPAEEQQQTEASSSKPTKEGAADTAATGDESKEAPPPESRPLV